ncbi:receptor-type tyrosine-protein phosphatase epsilon-like [Littorina saxatilis]|uniref:receptor-type tyrosine-protein phosphatase epsilon-like n=1 Tax=Littorina saxatilis TaxID=31220 RepID=UPI0038B68DE5
MDNCIHTAANDTVPWWKVDLGRLYPVHRIVVWARTAEIHRMKGCIIYVDGKVCYQFGYTEPSKTTNVTCVTGVLNGRNVTLAKNTTGFDGDNITINMCELEVLSCSDKYWGSGCDKRCGNCSNGEVCDKVTGHCSSCLPGFQPPVCDTDCKNGTFGQNCTQYCGEGCKDECNKVSGHCMCTSGWKEPLCDTDCENGTFGQNCSQTCDVSCADVCDKASGHCMCKPGWLAPVCEECEHGTFGHNCTQNCSQGCDDACDKASGNCTCKPGWKGLFCDSEISDEVPLKWILAGAVPGFLFVVVIVVVIMRCCRCCCCRKNVDTEEVSVQREHSSQAANDVSIYPNLPDGFSNVTMDGLKKDVQTDEANPVVAKNRKTKKRSKRAAVSKEVIYVNMAFEDGFIHSADSPSPHSSQATGATTVTAEEAEEDEVNVELEETEVDLEAEKQYEVEVRERVYYNDGVYMTSAGSDLKHDTVQESLLEKLRGETIDQEFESLPTGLKKAHDTGAKDENYYKNRFKSILPYEDTRVALHGTPDPGFNNYINASFVAGVDSPKAYIAAQGPNKNTVPDFWRMVWQEQVTHVVMLTNLKEGKKKKCEQYWPPPGKKIRYGSFHVIGLEAYERAHYVMRTFEVATENGSVRRVTQYHYTMWPDHGIPTTTGLVDFWRTVRTSHRQQQPSSSLVVHCSAGVGRTGTFIGLDILMDQLQQQQHIDICKVVNDMRNDRCNMIQAKSQYCILHEAVFEAYTSQDCRLQNRDVDSVFKHDVDPHHSNSRIDTEFKKLKQMKVLMQKPRHTEAEKGENINKNRYMDILPDDRYLARLTIPVKNRSDYINAAVMPSFKEQLGSILTQLPLRDTIVDLWRLVAGSKVSLVVCFGSEIVQCEEKSCYWPCEENEPLTIGPFIIRLTSRTTLSKHITQYSLSVQYEEKVSPRSVELLHYSDWKGDLPGSVEDLVHLVVTVLSAQSQQSHSEGPLLLQCSDGATKSGLLHAICDVISRMTTEGEIDVYMTVRHLQLVRPQCLMSKMQYRFIFRAMQEYKK